MRQSPSLNAKKPPLLGIRVGATTRTGREIYRGIFRYVRTHTRWRLAIDTTNRTDATNLPTCDAYIAAVYTDSIRDWAADLPSPVVNVSSRRDLSPSAHLRAQVRVEDHAIGRLAATHLLERAMPRFGFVGPPTERQAVLRREGFIECLREHHASCSVFDWRELDGSLEWAELPKWLQSLEYPIAILASNDDTGRLVTQACWESGIAVPEQVAVLGVDNDEVFCESSQPALSSIELGATRIGMEAARYTDMLLAGDTPDPIDLRLPPVNVQERASTDIVAIDDQDLAAVLQFIREHACDGISVDDALAVSGINRRLLERRFKQYLGCSPLEQINRVRMKRARDLLTNTALPMKQVAEKSGFAYLQTFYRAFTQHFGESPGSVRKVAVIGI